MAKFQCSYFSIPVRFQMSFGYVSVIFNLKSIHGVFLGCAFTKLNVDFDILVVLVFPL